MIIINFLIVDHPRLQWIHFDVDFLYPSVNSDFLHKNRSETDLIFICNKYYVFYYSVCYLKIIFDTFDIHFRFIYCLKSLKGLLNFPLIGYIAFMLCKLLSDLNDIMSCLLLMYPLWRFLKICSVLMNISLSLQCDIQSPNRCCVKSTIFRSFSQSFGYYHYRRYYSFFLKRYYSQWNWLSWWVILFATLCYRMSLWLAGYATHRVNCKCCWWGC
jgi:hypothetical protein